MAAYTRGNAFLLHKRKMKNWLSTCEYFGHLLTILPKGLMPRIFFFFKEDDSRLLWFYEQLYKIIINCSLRC